MNEGNGGGNMEPVLSRDQAKSMKDNFSLEIDALFPFLGSFSPEDVLCSHQSEVFPLPLLAHLLNGLSF